LSTTSTIPPDRQEASVKATEQDKQTCTSPVAGAQAENASTLPPNTHLHRTVGNRIYDWGIYTTFAWAGVAAVSLLSAHEAMHGRNPHFNWLRSLNNNIQKGVEGLLSKSILKNAPKETIEGWARGTSMFATLGLGGTTMMLPIKWLEDNRQKNACRIDNALGTTPPHPELVEKEVPQTWKSVLSGRMFAWGMSYVAFLAMGPKLTDKISKGFGKKVTDVIISLKPSANPVTVRKWADIGAFDATFTVITAALTYFTSRFVAKKSQHTMDAEATLMTIDPATPTPLEPLYNDQPESEKHVENTDPKRFADTHKPGVCSPRKPAESFAKKLHSQPENTPAGSLLA